MKIIKKGENILFINTSLFHDGEIEIIITSNMTQDKKVMTYNISNLTNIFQLKFEIVELNKEDLDKMLIYLDYGTHNIFIRQYEKEDPSKYIEYIDILYYDGDVLDDDKKYVKTKQNQRIYKK